MCKAAILLAQLLLYKKSYNFGSKMGPRVN